MEGQHQEWTGQSMSSLLRIVDDRGRRAVIAVDASVGVRRRRLAISYLVNAFLLVFNAFGGKPQLYHRFQFRMPLNLFKFFSMVTFQCVWAHFQKKLSSVKRA